MPIPADRTLLIYNGLEFRVGEPVSHEMKDELPIGATLWDVDRNNSRDDRWFTKVGHREWERSDGQHCGRLAETNHFRSLPDVEPEPAPEQETVANYRRRFAQWIPHRAEFRSKAHARAAQRGLATLGLVTEVGGTVTPESTPEVGTLAAFGAPHDEAFTVFEYTADGWRKGMGHFDTMVQVGSALVISTPNDAFAEVEGDQAQMIHEFQQQVWDVGHAISVEKNWCSEYERILEEFGICGDNLLPSLDTYMQITAADVRSLTTGSLIARRSQRGWHLKQRRPAGDGLNWNRLVGIPDPGGPAHLVRSGDEPCPIKPLVWHLPAGTQVGRPDHDENVWTKSRRGDWACEGAARRSSSRLHPEVRLLGLP